VSGKELFEEGRKGTYLATDEKALAKAQEKAAEAADQQRVKDEKAVAKLEKQRAKAEVEKARKERHNSLQAAFPGKDLQPHLRKVSAFLSGNNLPTKNLEWATQRLKELLPE
jgi:ATPase subunit of ABC transporter with duplicated ATPase domains